MLLLNATELILINNDIVHTCTPILSNPMYPKVDDVGHHIIGVLRKMKILRRMVIHSSYTHTSKIDLEGSRVN